jgi:hypothetical protein
MELASNKAFNLVIDEFQEFYNINASVYSDMQNIWDTYRKKSRMNLIVAGKSSRTFFPNHTSETSSKCPRVNSTITRFSQQGSGKDRPGRLCGQVGRQVWLRGQVLA